MNYTPKQHIKSKSTTYLLYSCPTSEEKVLNGEVTSESDEENLEIEILPD